MKNFISQITIENFKSIKTCVIEGCKRINLLIGHPNSEKSNILEALSTFSIPFLKENPSRSLTQLIRIKSETELFYNGNYAMPIKIETDKGIARIFYEKNEGLSVNIDTRTNGSLYAIDEKLNLKSKRNDNYTPFIRKYSFHPQQNDKRLHGRYLIPPYGQNIFNIIKRNETLKNEVANLFAEYRLNLVFDKASQSLKIMQAENRNEIFLVPYNSIAGTLQRIIFFKTAVASNEDYVLLFEEPEAHSFPPLYNAYYPGDHSSRKQSIFYCYP